MKTDTTEVQHALVFTVRPVGPDLERLCGFRFDTHVTTRDIHPAIPNVYAARDIHTAPITAAGI